MRMIIIYYDHTNEITQNDTKQESKYKSNINREEMKYEEVGMSGLRLCA